MGNLAEILDILSTMPGPRFWAIWGVTTVIVLAAITYFFFLL